MEIETISSQRLDETALPLVRHEQQPDIGLALRKEVLHRRGVIISSTVHAPGPILHSVDREELMRMIRQVERKVEALWKWSLKFEGKCALVLASFDRHSLAAE